MKEVGLGLKNIKVYSERWSAEGFKVLFIEESTCKLKNTYLTLNTLKLYSLNKLFHPWHIIKDNILLTQKQWKKY